MTDALYRRCHQSVFWRIYPLLFRLMYFISLSYILSKHIASIKFYQECALRIVQWALTVWKLFFIMPKASNYCLSPEMIFARMRFLETTNHSRTRCPNPRFHISEVKRAAGQNK